MMPFCSLRRIVVECVRRPLDSRVRVPEVSHQKKSHKIEILSKNLEPHTHHLSKRSKPLEVPSFYSVSHK
jgi:hypothetical protein